MAFRALHEVLQHEAAWTLGPHCQPAEVAMLALSCSELLCHLSVFAERFAIFEMGRCSDLQGPALCALPITRLRPHGLRAVRLPICLFARVDAVAV